MRISQVKNVSFKSLYINRNAKEKTAEALPYVIKDLGTLSLLNDTFESINGSLRNKIADFDAEKIYDDSNQGKPSAIKIRIFCGEDDLSSAVIRTDADRSEVHEGIKSLQYIPTSNNDLNLFCESWDFANKLFNKKH